jgi:hypothetical protein
MSNVEVQLRGNDRSAGLFNSVARSLRFVHLRWTPVGMTVGRGKTTENPPSTGVEEIVLIFKFDPSTALGTRFLVGGDSSLGCSMLPPSDKATA